MGRTPGTCQRPPDFWVKCFGGMISKIILFDASCSIYIFLLAFSGVVSQGNGVLLAGWFRYIEWKNNERVRINRLVD
jgi:hypothetical protein